MWLSQSSSNPGFVFDTDKSDSRMRAGQLIYFAFLGTLTLADKVVSFPSIRSSRRGVDWESSCVIRCFWSSAIDRADSTMHGKDDGPGLMLEEG